MRKSFDFSTEPIEDVSPGEQRSCTLYGPRKPPPRTPRIPQWLKPDYTAFLAVMIPVYPVQYGPVNFSYFCDVALLLTLVGIRREEALLISIPAVGIILPRILWCIDFLIQFAGGDFTGTTACMFDGERSLFLRGLSLFHGWLPFLPLYLVLTPGYDRRVLAIWSGLVLTLCLIAFFLLPPAGTVLAHPTLPRNVNYVFGLDDAHPRTLLPPPVYLGLWITAMIVIAALPTHFVLRKIRPTVISP